MSDRARREAIAFVRLCSSGLKAESRPLLQSGCRALPYTPHFRCRTLRRSEKWGQSRRFRLSCPAKTFGRRSTRAEWSKSPESRPCESKPDAHLLEGVSESHSRPCRKAFQEGPDER